MDKLVARFESLAVAVLMILVMATVVFSCAIITWSVYLDFTNFSELAAEPKALLDTFGLFVVILVGIELLRILKNIWDSHKVDTSLIVETALIALCNKIVTMNFVAVDWTTLIAIACLVLALVAAIFVLGHVRQRD